ncbi:hypothetical protein J3F83DRAFT_734223, partial [Trichoderma novae-zelandiae]
MLVCASLWIQFLLALRLFVWLCGLAARVKCLTWNTASLMLNVGCRGNNRRGESGRRTERREYERPTNDTRGTEKTPTY